MHKYFFFLAFLFAFNSFAIAVPHIDTNKTALMAKLALRYCRRNDLNTRYVILIDMSLHSGVKRFMVWNFKQKSIFISGLVSHGCGSYPWSGTWTRNHPYFSNDDGSHCTALGKYRIITQAYSNWGINVKYFLKGLDASNSNAMIRQVVFHSWEKVPENEVYPDGTPEGWGCPAISNETMKKVDQLIQKEKKHLLLWIYT